MADLTELARRALPPVSYGLRVATAVSLSLTVAFALQLDSPYWAGTTAALVSQPVLGSSLRKALFRSIGTIVGAIAAVAMFAVFPQDRVGFGLSLAAWCALCGFIGSRLKFFAAYGALLAGYTAAILGSNLVNSPDRTFDVALARVSEILLGIVVTTVVLSATQLDGSRERLAAALRGLASDAVATLLGRLAPATERPSREVDGQSLLSRLAALDAVVEQVAGEGIYRRFHFGFVRSAQNGLFACVACAETLRQDRPVGLDEAWFALPANLRRGDVADAASLRAAAERITVSGVPLCVTARLSEALLGAAAALDVAAWLDDPGRDVPTTSPGCTAPADPAPALINAARAFVVVSVMMVFWIVTSWPNGPTAVTVAAVVVLLLSPYQELGAKAAVAFVLGMVLTTILAAVAKFALLPQAPQAMWGLSAVLATVLVPLAALSTIPRLAPILAPSLMLFVPLVSPTNETIYDTAAFYNGAVGILGGCLAAAVTLRLIPPVPATTRTRRLLTAARAERAAVSGDRWRPSAGQWTDRMRTRAAELPVSAGADARNEVLTLFGQGMEAIRARPATGGVR